jgi:anthranilate phosphoribosyltransferase
VIGVSDPAFVETIAGALARLGVDRALVVSSEDGLDELSIAAATRVVEVNGDRLERYTLAPGDVGIEQISAEVFERDCAGGTPEQNANVTRAILGFGGDAEAATKPAHGPTTAAVELAVINAGAAIYAAGAVASIAEGVESARAALADGAAAEALARYVRASHANAPSGVAP